MADLVTLEQYKLYKSRNFHNASKKNESDIYYSNILLPGASGAIKTFFDNDFQSISRVETFSIERETKKIFPTHRPISSITSLVIDDSTIDSDGYELVIDQNAVVLSNDVSLAGVIRSTQYFPLGYNNTVLTYVGGQALTRADQFLLCKLIAKIDEDDTKTFTNVDGAEDTFFSALSNNNPFMQMLNDKFRNYRL